VGESSRSCSREAGLRRHRRCRPVVWSVTIATSRGHPAEAHSEIRRWRRLPPVWPEAATREGEAQSAAGPRFDGSLDPSSHCRLRPGSFVLPRAAKRPRSDAHPREGSSGRGLNSSEPESRFRGGDAPALAFGGGPDAISTAARVRAASPFDSGSVEGLESRWRGSRGGPE
jgi:hypothetical protein